MKSITLLLALIVCGASTLLADDRPAISARKALDLAEKDLADRNLAQKLYIVSITLERPSVFGGSTYWVIKWSEPIPASNPNNREIGFKVRMDGSVSRLVKEPH